jgi:hypothetical protein
VDDARALIVVAAAQAEVAQRCDQRRPHHSRRRVRDDTRGLVGDDHVLVDQGQRDLELDAVLGAGGTALGLVLQLDQLAPGEA